MGAETQSTDAGLDTGPRGMSRAGPPVGVTLSFQTKFYAHFSLSPPGEQYLSPHGAGRAWRRVTCQGKAASPVLRWLPPLVLMIQSGTVVSSLVPLA